MSDEQAAVGGDEAIAPIVPGNLDGEQVSEAQAYEAYVAKKNKTAESAEPATAENELSGEDNAAPPVEAHGEGKEIDPAEPLIDRPKSWTESEDAEWRATPRALQQKIVARELERDTALRRTQNDAAEKLKGLTAKEQEAEQAKQAFLSKVPTLEDIQRFVSQGPFADIKTQDDADALANNDPFRYLQWDSYQKRLSVVATQATQAQQLKAQERQGKRAAYEAEQTKLLTELVPEMADPKKASDLRTRAVAMLNDDLGLKNEQLSRWMADDTGHEILSNAGIQKLIADGLKFRDIQSAPKAIAAKPVPPVQRPGAAPPRGAAASENLQALSRKLSESGDVNDAFALYQARKTARA